MAADSVHPSVLGPLLETSWAGRPLEWTERCGSTNDVATARALADAPHGLCVLCEVQEQGRGRMGRTWFGQPGQSLCLSLLVRPPLRAGEVPPLSLAAGLAVHRALRGFEVASSVKWPNDILAGGKKIGGVLIEMACEGEQTRYVVIGVGINVNVQRETFPESLRLHATSMSLELGRACDRAHVAARMILELEAVYERFLSQGRHALLDEFRAAAAPMFGKSVRVVGASGESVEGIAVDIDGEAALLVRDPRGILHTITAGDVEMVGEAE